MVMSSTYIILLPVREFDFDRKGRSVLVEILKSIRELFHVRN